MAVFTNSSYRNKLLKFCRKQFSTKSIENLKRAVAEAENVVGPSVSLINSKWFKKSDKTTMIEEFKKVQNHPVLTVVQNLLNNQDTPSWYLIISLLSKAGGVTKEFSQDSYDDTGILHNQREVAKIAELLRKSVTFHKSMVHKQGDHAPNLNDQIGNKISVLSGIKGLTSVFEKSSNLKDSEITWIVFSCLKDLTQTSFFEPRDWYNNPIPARPIFQHEDVTYAQDFDKTTSMSQVMGNAKAEWTLRNLLDGATTLGKCCKSAVQIAHESSLLQKPSYLLGRNLELAIRITEDITRLDSKDVEPFNLINAPLMFHFQEKPNYYNSFIKDVEKNKINYQQIRDEVFNGNGIKKSIELQEEFINNALEALYEFPENDAKDSLNKLILSI